jgi:uncharacterized protein
MMKHPWKLLFRLPDISKYFNHRIMDQDITFNSGNTADKKENQSTLETSGQEPKPVTTTQRIKTVDLIRGFALLGILLMNIPGFGIDNSVFPAIFKGPHNTTDYLTVAVIFIFFDGTMRGLFSMLFGAGMILFTLNKKEQPGGVPVAEYYYRRLLWLVFFGVVNAYVFLWWGDILFFYGLCGMILYVFRNAHPKWLIILGFVCIGIGMLKTQLWYGETREKRKAYVEAVAAEKAKKKLTDEQQAAKTEWEQIEKRGLPDTARANRNIREIRSGYGGVFKHYLPINADDETWGTYHGIWDMLGMMFFGMGLFGLGFFSNKLSSSTYLMALAVGYGIGIPLGWLYFKGIEAVNINFGNYIDAWRAPHFHLYDFRRLFLAVGHASLLMLIFRSRAVPRLMKALANTGQMAFTNYLMQSLICTFIFHGYGLGYYHKLPFHQLYYIVLAVWIFQLIFSTIWMRYFYFGPFEWVWRSLTYWKKQPMKLSRATA